MQFRYNPKAQQMAARFELDIANPIPESIYIANGNMQLTCKSNQLSHFDQRDSVFLKRIRMVSAAPGITLNREKAFGIFLINQDYGDLIDATSRQFFSVIGMGEWTEVNSFLPKNISVPTSEYVWELWVSWASFYVITDGAASSTFPGDDVTWELPLHIEADIFHSYPLVEEPYQS